MEAEKLKPCEREDTGLKILEKCYRFTKADEMIAIGHYPYFRPIESAQDTEVYIHGKKMLMLGSNSYMGLTNEPRVKEAAINAIKKYGTGCAGSRFLNGTLDLHLELEEHLAKFVDKEAALVFSTGFQTNLGTIAGVVGRDDYVIIDKADHASIIDGTRLCFGKVVKFDHNNMEDLERVLSRCGGNGKLIVIDGIYSMEGDIANLPEIVRLAKKYQAGVMVDDAHSIGVLGEIGNGTASHFNLSADVDLIMGTFSKSLASIGGFIASTREVIQYLKHHSRPLIFSASIAPPMAATVLCALNIIITEPERRERLWYNTRKMQGGLRQLGYDIGKSETPIIPVVVGEDMTAFAMWKRLHEEGVFVNPVVSPAVPQGRALIRVSLMATHTDEHLDMALGKFAMVGKELGIV